MAPRCPWALPPFSLVLFTDDRRQPDLLSMLRRLPPVQNVGPIAILFRHYGLPAAERFALAEHVMRQVQVQGHIFLMARGEVPGADGTHAHQGPGIVTWPVHNAEEGRTAAAAGAQIGFASPIFPTRSHPGARGIGRSGLKRLAAEAPLPLFALGGMTAQTADRLDGLPVYGMGVIGAWSG